MGSAEVVVTGIGALSGPAAGAEAFWEAIRAPAPEQPTHRAIAGFDARRWLDRRQAQRTDPYAQVAVGAAALAKEDARLDQVDPGRTGVVMGVALGPLSSITEEHTRFLEGGAKHVSALMPVRTLPNANAAAVGAWVGIDGPCFALASGCASGTHAVGEGARLIERGACDVVLAGSSEAGIPEDGRGALDFLEAGLSHLRVITDEPVGRPFDVDRRGFVPAEGAAVVVLESAEHAAARNAEVYGRIVACANVLDGDLVAPDPSGDAIALAIRRALDEAGLAPGDVAHVNLHGSGTMANDLAEARAVHAVLGEPGPPVLSIKGVTGHSGAGAGALEAASVLLAMRHGLLPPTHGVRTVDPALGLDVVHGAARPWVPGPSLSLSLGLGGHVGCLVVLPPA
jgi:3-oxoacyl-[acyl-carrier-protein] synthase II